MVFDLSELEIDSSIESTSNVKVTIRIKPTLSQTIDTTEQRVEWSLDEEQNTISQFLFHQENNNSKQQSALLNSFKFDQVFNESSTTEAIYHSFARSIVHSAMIGFNGTIFAYGQTSSGKTFTMNGNQQNPGLIRFGLEEIFETIDACRSTNEFMIRMSYLEIYNEVITDLLNVDNKNLKIHETVNREIYVGNATEYLAMTLQNALDVLDKGESNRTISSTNINERSSRSHTILRIVIENRVKMEEDEKRTSFSSASGGVLRVATLNFVDLAGSERASQTGAEGLRLKEGGHINKSLLALTNVICKLAEGDEQRHIPFRDSKLTRILQPSLGGNSKTCIICTVSLLPEYCDETISTFKFALRAKSIKNMVRINEIISDTTKIKRLQAELDQLKSSHNNSLSLEQFQILSRQYGEVQESVKLVSRILQLINADQTLSFNELKCAISKKSQRMKELYQMAANEKKAYEDMYVEIDNHYENNIKEYYEKTVSLEADLTNVHTSYKAIQEQLKQKQAQIDDQNVIIEQLKAVVMESVECQTKEKEKYEKELAYMRTVLAEKDEQEAKEKTSLAETKKELSLEMDRRLELMEKAQSESELRNKRLKIEVEMREKFFNELAGNLLNIKQSCLEFQLSGQKKSELIAAVHQSLERVKLNHQTLCKEGEILLEEEQNKHETIVKMLNESFDKERKELNEKMNQISALSEEHKTNIQSNLSCLHKQLTESKNAVIQSNLTESPNFLAMKNQLKTYVQNSFVTLSTKHKNTVEEFDKLKLAHEENHNLLIKRQSQLKESLKKEATFDKIMKNLESQQIFGNTNNENTNENQPNPKKLLVSKKRKVESSF